MTMNSPGEGTQPEELSILDAEGRVWWVADKLAGRIEDLNGESHRGVAAIERREYFASQCMSLLAKRFVIKEE